MRFLSKAHKQRFKFFLEEDGTNPYDKERLVLFYILAGNSDLFTKRNYIYDFADRCISLDCLDSGDVDLSTSTKALIRLGFNLYNGYNNERTNPKVGRDILFIERNIDFLKPGGRMAIVLPQGRFNNSSDKRIRDYICEHCRILAVVGLHPNTFKPHTGTKTSVLFVQKWNDDPSKGALCKKADDYNIFFATMQKSGKDNSGEKIFVKAKAAGENILAVEETLGNYENVAENKDTYKSNEENNIENGYLLDSHGHLIVDHDLFNHDGLTEDGIAEAFIEFAKKEKLSFF